MVSVHCNPAAHFTRRTSACLWDEHIEPAKSIITKPEGVGAAIGRLIWQAAMGLYINDEIKWLTEECGVDLVCFVDDIVFILPEERHQYLLALLPELRRRLERKNVRLNEKKFYDQRAVHGCEFLGSHIRPNRIHLNNATYHNAVERIREMNGRKYKNIDEMVSVFNSYSGLLKNRCDHKRLVKLKEMLSPEWFRWLVYNEEKQCLSYKEGFGVNDRLSRKYKLRIKKRKNQAKNREPSRRSS